MRGFWIVFELLGTLAAVAVLVTAVRLDPDPRGYGTHEGLGLAPCGYLAKTGQKCLSCGLTTSFSNLAHLRPGAAWNANPAGIPLFLLALVSPFWLLHALGTGRDPFRFLSDRLGRWVLPAVTAVLVVTWILREGLPMLL